MIRFSSPARTEDKALLRKTPDRRMPSGAAYCYPMVAPEAAGNSDLDEADPLLETT